MIYVQITKSAFNRKFCLTVNAQSLTTETPAIAEASFDVRFFAEFKDAKYGADLVMHTFLFADTPATLEIQEGIQP